MSLLDHLQVLGTIEFEGRLELGRIQGKHLDLKMELYMRLELELLEPIEFEGVQGHQPRLALVLVLFPVVLYSLCSLYCLCLGLCPWYWWC